jgi:hypothetical protein
VFKQKIPSRLNLSKQLNRKNVAAFMETLDLQDLLTDFEKDGGHPAVIIYKLIEEKIAHPKKGEKTLVTLNLCMQLTVSENIFQIVTPEIKKIRTLLGQLHQFSHSNNVLRLTIVTSPLIQVELPDQSCLYIDYRSEKVVPAGVPIHDEKIILSKYIPYEEDYSLPLIHLSEKQKNDLKRQIHKNLLERRHTLILLDVDDTLLFTEKEGGEVKRRFNSLLLSNLLTLCRRLDPDLKSINFGLLTAREIPVEGVEPDIRDCQTIIREHGIETEKFTFYTSAQSNRGNRDTSHPLDSLYPFYKKGQYCRRLLGQDPLLRPILIDNNVCEVLSMRRQGYCGIHIPDSLNSAFRKVQHLGKDIAHPKALVAVPEEAASDALSPPQSPP